MERETKPNPLEWFGARACDVIEQVMPDPFLFAILLTFVAFVWGWFGTAASAVEMVDHWVSGFWGLIDFAYQMVIILVTGYVIADHPRVRRGLSKLAGFPSSTGQAVMLVSGVAIVSSWINWGLGLIAGALMAREVGRRSEERGLSFHYPIIVAAGYTGLAMIWHWGLSSSAALKSAETGQSNPIFSVVGRAIPTVETIFHPFTIALAVLSLVFTMVVLYLMAPSSEESIRTYSDFQDGEDELDEEASEDQEQPSPETFGDYLNRSALIGGALSLLGMAGMVLVIRNIISDYRITLNRVNFLFLFAGFTLYLRPIRYLEAFYGAVKSSAGIILQFPFYFGIMGMIRGSGLSEQIARWLISHSSPETLPLVSWLTAGILNIFIPSGGGEWAVMGEIITEAAVEQGVPVGHIIIAYGAGDQWTNLLQPFWAIPLLGICGIRAREVFGYTVALMIISVLFYGGAFLLAPVLLSF